jgi:hypothetical protein
MGRGQVKLPYLHLTLNGWAREEDKISGVG